jgi:hypothetical protein
MSKFKEQNESNAPMASTPKGSLRRRLTLYSIVVLMVNK